MKEYRLQKAEQAARALLTSIGDLEEKQNPTGFGDYYGSKYTAAVRRKSMDLTRSLADLRRPD